MLWHYWYFEFRNQCEKRTRLIPLIINVMFLARPCLTSSFTVYFGTVNMQIEWIWVWKCSKLVIHQYRWKIAIIIEGLHNFILLTLTTGETLYHLSPRIAPSLSNNYAQTAQSWFKHSSTPNYQAIRTTAAWKSYLSFSLWYIEIILPIWSGFRHWRGNN